MAFPEQSTLIDPQSCKPPEEKHRSNYSFAVTCINVAQSASRATVYRIDIALRAISATDPQLSCFVATPAGKPIARLAILHGYGDHAGRYSHFMQWLAEHGIASYAVDFRGHGRSAGKPGFVHRWDDYLTDLRAFLAIDELSTANDLAPLFLLAHSHCALVAINAAYNGMLNHCRGVILSAPYLDFENANPGSQTIFWPPHVGRCIRQCQSNPESSAPC